MTNIGEIFRTNSYFKLISIGTSHTFSLYLKFNVKRSKVKNYSAVSGVVGHPIYDIYRGHNIYIYNISLVLTWYIHPYIPYIPTKF